MTMEDSNIQINGKSVPTMTFTGGEIHLSIANLFFEGPAKIDARIKNSDDVMRLLLVTDALRANGCKKISLNLPYVPYARQDRRCNPGEAHSLKVFASLINAQHYRSVTVFDPHSDVVEALINNVVVKNNHNFIIS